MEPVADLYLVAASAQRERREGVDSEGAADRKNTRPCGAAPAGAPPSAPRAAHSKAERGAARRWLRLDRRRRMGEGSAAGVPWGAGLGTGGLERLGGDFTLRSVRHPSAARTSPTRPRATSWLRQPTRTLLGAHEQVHEEVGQRPACHDAGGA